MKKHTVFVSHISAEKSLAIAIKRVIELSFLSMVQVFVSSDGDSIPVGKRWLDSITDGLKNCVAEIIIASPTSVQRPWVNFEAGAAWVRDIPVIPICYLGMTPSKLPTPLNALQAIRADQKSDLNQLITLLAKEIECDVPTLDWSNFLAEVKRIELAATGEGEIPF